MQAGGGRRARERFCFGTRIVSGALDLSYDVLFLLNPGGLEAVRERADREDTGNHELATCRSSDLLPQSYSVLPPE